MFMAKIYLPIAASVPCTDLNLPVCCRSRYSVRMWMYFRLLESMNITVLHSIIYTASSLKGLYVQKC